MKYETNIFKIENLEQLSAGYLLYEIVGLLDDDDKDINLQFLIERLSYELRHPVTVIKMDQKPMLVVRNEAGIAGKVPESYKVKKNALVYFRKQEKPLELDFVNYTPETKNIILRFIQFDIQSELNKHTDLWQPGSGDAFFNRVATESNDEINIFNGFFARAVEIPGRGFGVAIDITKKYLSKFPLPVRLSRNDFNKQRIKQSHFVYQYGDTCFEIKVEEFSDLNASQYRFDNLDTGRNVSLLENIQQRFPRVMPPEIARLPDDASALVYKTNQKEERRAIAGLCYRVFDTEDPKVSKLHRRSIIDPFYRRRLLRVVHRNYLGNLMYGKIRLVLSKEPIGMEQQIVKVPDFCFGNDITLSLRQTPGAQHCRIEELGAKRKALLSDDKVGFYTNATFERQLFVVPQTIYNMYGNETYFLRDLSNQVNSMHQSETGWKPIIVTYDDRGKHNAVQIGFEIIQQIENKVNGKGGYALIMLPSGVERLKRQHDELAALVVSELLSNHDITASIMHADMLQESYGYNRNGVKPSYYIRSDQKNRYRGYVRGVAINQVLLNNERWPYVLGSSLHADITIGIDVKRQVAGFTFVDKHSKNILTKFHKSDNKERLSTAQIMKMLIANITLLSENCGYAIHHIVIHRDGRLFAPERKGILDAVALLKSKGRVSSDCTINIVEIPKQSVVPFRLFDVIGDFDVIRTNSDNGKVLNPKIGSWVKMNDNEAYICTTGREFRRNGSSHPLFIKYESGGMEIEKVIEDIYFLSCLAYTKPDDCSRYPITIKITDRRINTLGSDFNFEELEIRKSQFI